MTVTGVAGTVSRLRPARMAEHLPIHTAPGCIVDAWEMPGGMHVVCLRGSSDEYALLLCYVDETVRSTCLLLGMDPALAVDVWHFQQMPGVDTDEDARAIVRHVMRAAADNVLPFEPFRANQRGLWRVTIDSLAAVQTRRPLG
jgi:hypothetical protein